MWTLNILNTPAHGHIIYFIILKRTQVLHGLIIGSLLLYSFIQGVKSAAPFNPHFHKLILKMEGIPNWTSVCVKLLVTIYVSLWSPGFIML